VIDLEQKGRVDVVGDVTDEETVVRANETEQRTPNRPADS
jgi:hypothetical protein